METIQNERILTEDIETVKEDFHHFLDDCCRDIEIYRKTAGTFCKRGYSTAQCYDMLRKTQVSHSIRIGCINKLSEMIKEGGSPALFLQSLEEFQSANENWQTVMEEWIKIAEIGNMSCTVSKELNEMKKKLNGNKKEDTRSEIERVLDIMREKQEWCSKIKHDLDENDKETAEKQKELISISNKITMNTQNRKKLDWLTVEFRFSEERVNEACRRTRETEKELERLLKLNDILPEICQTEEAASQKPDFFTRVNFDCIKSVEDKMKKIAAIQSQLALQNTTALHDTFRKVSALPGVFGPVFSLARVKDDRYSDALNAAAFDKLRLIAVSDTKSGENAIQFMKDNGLGRFTFIPLDKLPEVRFLPINEPEVIDYAVNLLEFNPLFRNLFNAVLENTVVVKDNVSARSISMKYRAVTLTGEVYEQKSLPLISGGRGFFGMMRCYFGSQHDEDEYSRISTSLDAEKVRLVSGLKECCQVISKRLKTELDEQISDVKKQLQFETDKSLELKNASEKMQKEMDELKKSVAEVNAGELSDAKQQVLYEVRCLEWRKESLATQLKGEEMEYKYFQSQLEELQKGEQRN